MSNTYPKEIVANKTLKELTVTWSDAHTSVYPFALLRNACPCEVCRGGHENMGDTPPREVFYMPIEDKPATQLVSVEAVGAYAISIRWEDGHRFGIYNWRYLRALCPCPMCREEWDHGQ